MHHAKQQHRCPLPVQQRCQPSSGLADPDASRPRSIGENVQQPPSHSALGSAISSGSRSQTCGVDSYPSSSGLGEDDYCSSNHSNLQAGPRRLPRQQHPFHSLNLDLAPLQEYHSGFTDADVGSCPSPSSPSRSSQTSHHQESFSGLLPNALRPRTPSPTRHPPRLPPPEMPYTGDGDDRGELASPRSGGLAGWLSGTTAAGVLGMSASTHGSDQTPTSARTGSRQMSPRSTPTRPLPRLGPSNHSSTAPPRNAVTSPTTAASRFVSAAIARFAAAPAVTTNPALDDELCSLDIEAALFPVGGIPTSADHRNAFSPAAFKNLQTNATGVLNKMQTAYRQRVAALRDMQIEQSAQRDEFEEATTRARHLKMQLEGIAAKAAEQETAMLELMNQLLAEKAMRTKAEEKLARLKAVHVEGSLASEDLGVDDDRRRRTKKWRASTGTEASFDSDDEAGSTAESESVFSRSRSPTIAPSIVESGLGSADVTPKSKAASATAAPVRTRTGLQPPQMSTFQKIIKNVSGEGAAADGKETVCPNCMGQDASVAWDTVSLLRDENRHLKQRTGQLEVAVEAALDLVNGVGLG